MFVFTLILFYLFSQIQLFSLSPSSKLGFSSGLESSFFKNKEADESLFSHLSLQDEGDQPVCSDTLSLVSSTPFYSQHPSFFHPSSVRLFSFRLKCFFIVTLFLLLLLSFYCQMLSFSLNFLFPLSSTLLAIRYLFSFFVVGDVFLGFSLLLFCYRLCHKESHRSCVLKLRKKMPFLILLSSLTFFLLRLFMVCSFGNGLNLCEKVFQLMIFIFLLFPLGMSIILLFRQVFYFFKKLKTKGKFFLFLRPVMRSRDVINKEECVSLLKDEIENDRNFYFRKSSALEMSDIPIDNHSLNISKKNFVFKTDTYDSVFEKVRRLKKMFVNTFKPSFFLLLPILMLGMTNFIKADYLIYLCFFQMFFFWCVLCFFIYMSFKNLEKGRVRSFYYSFCMTLFISGFYLLFQFYRVMLSPLPSMFFLIDYGNNLISVSLDPLIKMFHSSSFYYLFSLFTQKGTDIVLSSVDLFYMVFLFSNLILSSILFVFLCFLMILSFSFFKRRVIYSFRFLEDEMIERNKNSFLRMREDRRYGLQSENYLHIPFLFCLALLLNFLSSIKMGLLLGIFVFLPLSFLFFSFFCFSRSLFYPSWFDIYNSPRVNRRCCQYLFVSIINLSFTLVFFLLASNFGGDQGFFLLFLFLFTIVYIVSGFSFLLFLLLNRWIHYRLGSQERQEFELRAANNQIQQQTVSQENSKTTIQRGQLVRKREPVLTQKRDFEIQILKKPHLSDLEKRWLDINLDENSREAYHLLRRDLYYFFDGLFRIERDFPFMHQFIYQYSIIDFSQMKDHHRLEFRFLLPEDKREFFDKEWTHFSQGDFPFLVSFYLSLWRSSLRKKQEETLPLLFKYLMEQEQLTEEEIEERKACFYYIHPIFCLEDIFSAYQVILFFLEEQKKQSRCLNQKSQYDKDYQSVLLEKNRFNQMKDKDVWKAFHCMNGEGKVPSFQWIGQCMYDSLVSSLDKTLFLMHYYKWTYRAYMELPFLDKEGEESLHVVEKNRDLCEKVHSLYKTEFCRTVALKGNRLDHLMGGLLKFDDRLCQDDFLKMKAECDSFIPVIWSGSVDQVRQFLMRLSDRVNRCVIAIYTIPIDLYEIYHQYPDHIEDFDDAFLYILMEKRSQIVRGLSNLEGQTHDLRQIVYQLSNSSCQMVFHPSFFQRRPDILDLKKSTSYYLSKFCENFRVEQVFLEEILPLFWCFHKGVTTEGRQFRSMARMMGASFLDTACEDYMEGGFYFVDPLFLFEKMIEYFFISPDFNRSICSVDSYFKKKKLYQKKLHETFNQGQKLSSLSPQQFSEYFRGLSFDDKLKVLEKIDVDQICERFFPVYILKDSLNNFDDDLKEILSIYFQIHSTRAIQLLNVALLFYGEKIFYEIFNRDRVEKEVNSFFQKLFHLDYVSQLGDCLCLIRHSSIAQIIYPLIIQNYSLFSSQLVKKLKQSLFHKNNMDCLFLLDIDLVYELFSLFRVPTSTFVDFMKHVYTYRSSMFISFYQKLLPLYIKKEVSLFDMENCVIHMTNHFSFQNPSLFYFFICHSKENQVKEWIHYYQKRPDFVKKYRHQVIDSLKIQGYYQTLFDLYFDEGQKSDINDLIFNLFIKKEWRTLYQLSQMWMDNVEDCFFCFESLFLCFEFLHPHHLTSDFCVEFETYLNPLYDLYVFYEKNKHFSSCLEIVASYQIHLLSLQQSSLTHSSSFQKTDSLETYHNVDVFQSSFALRSA